MERAGGGGGKGLISPRSTARTWLQPRISPSMLSRRKELTEG